MSAKIDPEMRKQIEGCQLFGERVVLASDYDAVVDNRDGWMASCGDWKERALAAEAERDRIAAECEGLEAENTRFVKERDAAVLQLTNRDCQIIALKAERDKLTATVRRVSALLQNTRSQNILACEVSRALAEPMDRPEWTRCEITGCTCGPMHGYGKCVERRKP